MSRRSNIPAQILAGALVAMVLGGSAAGATPAEEAASLRESTGAQGGLVVHVGCDDGALTAALAETADFLVHGLTTDPEHLRAARKNLQKRGLYGRASVDRFDGRSLPYVDNTARLVVVGPAVDVPREELQRVVAFEGVLATRTPDRWSTWVKPRPQEVDTWTHFLHDASGNAVADDQRVGPPKALRWVAEPRWCRSHEIPSSVNAIVTDGKRIFTIFDEAPTGVHERLPQKCRLVARDAASGTLLWKVPMQDWQPEFGTGVGNRWNIHHTIPRRLVAVDGKVYVTLRFLDSPVSVLDAATGEILVDAVPGTQGTDEIVVSEGVLVAKLTTKRSVGATDRFGKDALRDTLVAIDLATDEPLWRKDDVRVVPYALSAAQGCLVYHDMESLVCLDLQSGATRWETANPMVTTLGAASSLVIAEDVVLFHGHGLVDPSDPQGKSGLFLTAVSLRDGAALWRTRGQKGQAGACTQPTDLFAIDGTVWLGGSTEGYDLHTGELVQRVTLDRLISPGHHYRCHRSKATSNYLIWPKRGAEFIDLADGEHMRNDWLRAPCFTGATPANGLFYVPPSQCFCYPGVKVYGFLAMSSDPPAALVPSSADALQRGEAYAPRLADESVEAGDWPMYRRDAQRSGATQAAVPTDLERKWSVQMDAVAAQPIVVGDRVWVVEKDAHRVRCLDAATGQSRWSFTAGGRIDSPPTYQGGRVYFGCRDGWVYCLDAERGQLVWRFRAAPRDRRLVAYGQIESLWPVEASVLVQDGLVYFAAGRSSFLDGGMIVYALDAATGAVRHTHLLEGPWPDIHSEVGTPFAMEGALPDLLVSDGQNLYMQRVKFDGQLNRLPTHQESPLGELDMGANHLVATGGFLDDTGFDRLYWMYSHRWPGFYFAQHAPKSGQLVVFDDETTYAVKYFYRRIQWSPAFIPNDQGYLLFADANDNQPVFEDKKAGVEPVKWLPEEAYADQHRRGGRGVEKGTGYQRAEPPLWQQMVSVRVRAMVLAGDRIFAAGPPDTIDPADPLATFEGRTGAQLAVYSAEDGRPLASMPLATPPVFDGISAAHGRLFIATQDGKVHCFGEK